MIEVLFLNVIAAVSDNWRWLGPVLVVCILALIACEVKETFEDMLKDMEEQEETEVRCQKSEIGKGQKSDIRSRRSGRDRSQMSEIRGRTSDI